MLLKKQFLFLHKHAVLFTTRHDFLNDFFANRLFLGARNPKVAKERLEPFGTPTRNPYHIFRCVIDKGMRRIRWEIGEIRRPPFCSTPRLSSRQARR
jgi:hypothetical protein